MLTLNKFYNFVEKLKQNNSRNYKISVLNEYKDDEDIKYYLNFLFNPYITTGISDKKLSKYASIIENTPDRLGIGINIKTNLNNLTSRFLNQQDLHTFVLVVYKNSLDYFL